MNPDAIQCSRQGDTKRKNSETGLGRWDGTNGKQANRRMRHDPATELWFRGSPIDTCAHTRSVSVCGRGATTFPGFGGWQGQKPFGRLPAYVEFNLHYPEEAPRAIGNRKKTVINPVFDGFRDRKTYPLSPIKPSKRGAVFSVPFAV